MSKQSFRTLFGDILNRWLLRHVEDVFIMFKCKSPYEDFVFSLSKDKFAELIECVDKRKDKELYDVTSFEEAAIKYNRIPVCPTCLSSLYIENGYTPAGHKRYKCLSCERSYTILSDSIFNSTKISFHKLMKYIQLMTFNVPLEQCMEILNIASNTANLWRKKIFQTVNGYQNHLKLKDKIWLDETYIEDYQILGSEYTGKRPRGLSRTKICIVVAIDVHKNMVAIICGHGKPSSNRILKSLKDHIIPNSVLIHDGENSHIKLIEELNLKSKVYKADCKNENYLNQMALINRMCGWIKRYIWRFIGMDIENLQSYLNWYIYLQRCKRDDEIWPKSERILRHLVLERTRYTRK